ncbi:MAG: sulfite exporter TauE/SafE family protein [Caulobacterales bacterium]
MSIYLPIAEMTVNPVLILLLSVAVGYLSGLIGVGGGFIMTPILIFLGVPPAVAVSTEASQISASSVSGVLAYRKRRLVDVRMGLVLTIGGVLGATWGVQIFAAAKRQGQIDVLITLLYVFFLSVIGGLMLWESVRALRRKAKGAPPPRRARTRTLAHVLPLRIRFPQSGLYISVLPPLALGFAVGVLSALMGIGGGFLLVPAMIYLLRMPTQVVVGTSLMQVLIVTCITTLQLSVQTRTVDLVLAVLLIVGGVIGAQFGVRMGLKLSAERLRAILAVVIVATAAKLLWDLVQTPPELFTLGPRL